jgi:hypothetical protein
MRDVQSAPGYVEANAMSKPLSFFLDSDAEKELFKCCQRRAELEKLWWNTPVYSRKEQQTINSIIEHERACEICATYLMAWKLTR